MTATEQRLAAQQFVKDWRAHGDEKQETQRFWMGLLQKVFGVAEPDQYIEFEMRVMLGHTSFIDGYIRSTRVLIEQKGADIDLTKGYRQSDGSMQTPYQQARRYAGHLAHDMHPRWIVVCNFREFHIHDMNRPNDPPEVVLLQDLAKEYHRLQFLVDTGSETIKKEMEVSLKAGELVGKLYEALLKQYNSPASAEELRSLNILCIRLVFCLFSEDSGVFGGHTMFYDYLKSVPTKNIRNALLELFDVLDTKPSDRDPYMEDALAAFPYVSGGLFADKNIIIPKITEEIAELLLSNASKDFNWSSISPTIFGAVFESTLNPDTRRSGGMHYTSIENIHKVIDPLFLDDLKAELESIAQIGVVKTRNEKLEAFQNKLASLTFLDPACGSGNFLTETYLSLRRLENKAVALRMGDQIVMGEGDFDPIKVKINQFYGIEINDFAVTVAQAALWIAESQMMKETEEIVHSKIDFLPLTSYANIIEGNALRLDWETIVPKHQLSYIMGNPPFVGYSLQTKEQKDDILSVYVDEKGKPYKTAGKVDYVAGWYFKAAQMMSTESGHSSEIRTAFVSTNSITQGEQVAAVWKPLYERFGIHIDFAHRTFRWDSEASVKAHVHCVIVGFSSSSSAKERRLYASERVQVVSNINAYLLPADDVLISSRTRALCDVPQMIYGSKPTDGGHLFLTPEEKEKLLAEEPNAQKYVKQVLGAEEYINNKKRYCLWLVGASPADLKRLPLVMARIEGVRNFRANSSKEATRKSAETPTLFQEVRQPTTEFILVPRVSSEARKYIPIGFMNPEIIVNDAVQVIPEATLYHFGILTSNVHMAWMRAVCGRLKSDYRYSKDIVYNNFPWPTPTDVQRAKIEKTAQAILDARALYPDCSLADLYDEAVMPPELRTAHQQNDRAVMEAYGFWGKLNSEPECVAALMKMYQALTQSS